MKPELTIALDIVLRDLRGSGVPVPRVRDQEWAEIPDTASAMLVSDDGSGTGIYIYLDQSEDERLASVADKVQEWAVEELWPDRATNWPPCPHHPDTHPLSAQARAGVAVWTCPLDGTPFAAVGSLDP